MGIAALILGISSLFCGIFGWFIEMIVYFGLAAGIAGIVLASVNKNPAQRGMATTGKVLSIIGLVLCALIITVALVAVGLLASIF